MPQYYFNVMGDGDPEGTPFPSPSNARKEGLKFLGSLLLHEEITPRQGEPCVEITDVTGAVLFRLGVEMSDIHDERAAGSDGLISR